VDKWQKIQESGKIYELFREAHQQFFAFWYKHDFLHAEWWFGVFILGAPWVFWIWYRQKESTMRLLHAGMFMMWISFFLDYLGAAVGLWHYAGKLTPTMAGYIPLNFAALPVITMILLQWRPALSKYWKGLIFGLFNAYVGEPLYVLLGIYVMTGWKYHYSVPIYFLLFLIAHRIAYSHWYEPITKNE